MRTRNIIKIILQLTVLLSAMANGIQAYAVDWIYTVRPGDNLWNLTEKYLKHMGYVPRLQARNNVANPRRIPPGTKLRIPIPWVRIQPAAAKIIEVSGQVEVKRDVDNITTNIATANVTANATANATAAAAIGLELLSGDELQTSDDGNVLLEFADGSRFSVRENTRLTMDTLSAFGDSGMVDTRMRLWGGRLNGNVQKEKAGGSRFEIQTPAAVASVRGTDYRVAYSIAETTLRTEVLDGRVAVTGSGRQRSLRRGFGTITEVGKPPRPPRRLLPPPDVQSINTLVERVPIKLQWPAVRDAASYRVQMAAAEDFATLLFNATVDEPQVAGPDIPDGDYFLRLRAIDQLGLEGRDVVVRFTLNARPEPPFIVDPQMGQVVRVDNPVFEWAQSEQAVSFNFQLAASEDFSNPVVDFSEYKKVKLLPDPVLLPGDYVWRIATRDRSGELGPYSDVQTFSLRPTPTPESELAEQQMTVQWPAGLPGERYRFQFTKDEWFEKFLVDERLDQPTITIPRPQSGRYYLRLAVIGADGVQGPFGERQIVDIPIQNIGKPISIFTVLGILIIL